MNELEKARLTINETDENMAELFCRRMKAAEAAAAYKKEHGLPVYDAERETELLKRNAALIEDGVMRSYYTEFLQNTVAISRAYQEHLIGADADTVTVGLGARSYDIIVKRGSLSASWKYLDLDRKALIVTDDGMPPQYAEQVKAASKDGHILTVPQGEASKSFEQYQRILSEMLSLGFGRGDCVVAVGGGVCGDLAGFAAATYMRGIDFYNVPTTVLSMVDSSIGGKTAIDFCGVKNAVGAFNQPKRVLIDADVLSTLPKRQISNGFAEAVKMALTFDNGLFSIFERDDPTEKVDEIIRRSLLIKKAVVEEDETEKGLRRVLNFGHTIGHGIESAVFPKLYHGECVALGMLPMCSDEVRGRLLPVLEKLGLPTKYRFDKKKAFDAIKHDKKGDNGKINVITVQKPGSYQTVKTDLSELFEKMIKYYGEDI